MTARVARCSRIPEELAGDSRRTRRETRAEAKNSKNTVKTLAHKQEVKGSLAHTGDRTGPTQPRGELGKENPYLHDGGIELHGEILINLAHESHTRDLYTQRGAISQEGLYNSKRSILNRGLVLGYNLLGNKP